MKKQTFIVSTWYGATSYIEAARKEANEGYNPEKYGHDFYRLSCKKLETALKYLAAWKAQAKEKGLNFLYRDLLQDGAQYMIMTTPDGYNEKDVVAAGYMSEL